MWTVAIQGRGHTNSRLSSSRGHRRVSASAVDSANVLVSERSLDVSSRNVCQLSSIPRKTNSRQQSTRRTHRGTSASAVNSTKRGESKQEAEQDGSLQGVFLYTNAAGELFAMWLPAQSSIVSKDHLTSSLRLLAWKVPWSWNLLKKQSSEVLGGQQCSSSTC